MYVNWRYYDTYFSFERQTRDNDDCHGPHLRKMSIFSEGWLSVDDPVQRCISKSEDEIPRRGKTKNQERTIGGDAAPNVGEPIQGQVFFRLENSENGNVILILFLYLGIFAQLAIARIINNFIIKFIHFFQYSSVSFPEENGNLWQKYLNFCSITYRTLTQVFSSV